jgi:hypothetical protein
MINFGMHIQLLLPDLFWPEHSAADVYGGLELAALERLLAKGRLRAEGRQRIETAAETPASAEDWLGQRFGLEQDAGWPIAACSLLADGGEPGAHQWLRADPVHLRLEGGRLMLADSGVFAISQQEAGSIADSLNAHFAGDGLVFYPLRPERWYLRLVQAPALQTTPLAQAAGRNIDALLPRGADAPLWHARLNEIQMLLHGHAVNELRESTGAPAINSVWLWGGGSLPRGLPAAFNAVWSRDPYAAGLAQAARVASRPLPDDASALLDAGADSGVHLVLLDQLRAAARYGDAQGWREGLQQLERDWFAPLLQALKQERIGMLSLHALGPAGTLSSEVAHGDLRRFWRRAKPLAHYA